MSRFDVLSQGRLIAPVRRLFARVLPPGLKRRLKQSLGLPARRLHPDWSILSMAGPLETSHVVLDVGAHHGWFLHCWKDWCPAAEIHAFEPAAEAFEHMSSLYGAQPGVRLCAAGVGESAGELELRILADSQVSNSFLDPDPSVWRSIAYTTGAVSTRRVPVVTLDGYARENAIGRVHLIKIDVQGFELRVLQGARELLRRTDWVLVESGIRRLYRDAPNFGETVACMEEVGFHLVDLRAWHRGNRVLVETDLLFRRDELAPPIDHSRDRSYLALRP